MTAWRLWWQPTPQEGTHTCAEWGHRPTENLLVLFCCIYIYRFVQRLSQKLYTAGDSQYRSTRLVRALRISDCIHLLGHLCKSPSQGSGKRGGQKTCGRVEEVLWNTVLRADMAVAVMNSAEAVVSVRLTGDQASQNFSMDGEVFTRPMASWGAKLMALKEGYTFCIWGCGHW